MGQANQRVANGGYALIIDEEDYLAHYGIRRRSGRYPWGSGADSVQRSQTFLGMVQELANQGLSQTEIARGLKTLDTNESLNTNELRNLKTLAKAEIKQAEIDRATKLRDKGMSPTEIGKTMGKNESTVRTLLAPGAADKARTLNTIADMLREEFKKSPYIDVGAGVEYQMGVTRDKLDRAITFLKDEGFVLHKVQTPQLTTPNLTTIKALCVKGTEYLDVKKNIDMVRAPIAYSDDGGRTALGILKPMGIDPKRVAVIYKEDGGGEADGTIYVRPGVNDVALGGQQYAQVRINVGNTHFLKGMAVYKKDLPPGVDLAFNTDKSNTGNKLDAMKPMKRKKDAKGLETDEIDWDNPFGAELRRQIGIKNEAGRLEKLTSVMNLVNEEGNWEEWNRSLSSQMLSKQTPELAQQQLRKLQDRKKEEYDEIMALTNPNVRRKLLEEFADSADSAAVHLKAASINGQSTKVIMPIRSLKNDEVYAPTYENGERVVLIRFPHGGTFEIPELKVNNRNREARDLLGTAPEDAIGINSKVAHRLSGADFDGDTVLVIPQRGPVNVKTSPPLKGLDKFDPKREFGAYDGMKTIDGGVYNATTKKVEYGGKKPNPRAKGQEMGYVTNLISDMTIKRASDDEIARAVKHSMVVIDSEKHALDYKRSFEANGIASLYKKYQGRTQGGGATIVSRRKREIELPELRKRRADEGGFVDPATGKRMYVPTGNTYYDRKTGTRKVFKQKYNLLDMVDDANDPRLSSGTLMEKMYGDHSNTMKSLANQARKSSLSTGKIAYSKAAAEAYSSQVKRLNNALAVALQNAPLERQAQVIGNAIYKQQLASNPDMTGAEKKKIKSQALTEARMRTGAGKERIVISPDEWAAIQAGALTPSRLDTILTHAEMDTVKQLATPRTPILMTSAKQRQAQTLLASGATQAEVAARLGVSLTTLKTALS